MSTGARTPRARSRLSEVDTLDSRQPTVDDQHVPRPGQTQVQTLLTVAGQRDGVLLLLQQADEEPGQLAVVLDEQQPGPGPGVLDRLHVGMLARGLSERSENASRR